MISVSPARRRAEEFAALVDGRSSDGDGRFSDLLELVADLREAPAATPRAAFVDTLRSQLMAAADEALAPVDSRLALPAHPRSRRDRRVAVAAGAFVFVGATSSVAVAAQSALPGDALYPIKRVLESAQTSVQANEAARAEAILDNASGRLEEAEALALRDSAESQAAMPDTLDDFVTQSNQAADLLISEYDQTGDRGHIFELRGFTADSLGLLAGLKPALPAELADELDAAVHALLDIDARALAACPDCGGLLEIPLSLVASGGTVPELPLSPMIAPPPTIEAPEAPKAGGSDPVKELISGLPLINGEPLPGLPGSAGGEGTEGPTHGDGTQKPPTVDPKKPLAPVTDPLLEQGGLLGAEGPLGVLLDPVLGTLPADGGLLGGK